METPTLVAIIAASGAILLHFVQQHFARLADLRVRKIPIYTELLEAIQAALHVLRAKADVTLKPELTSKVVTWGSSAVVLAYAELRMHFNSKEPNLDEIKKVLGTLLTGIRKDLGHSDGDAGTKFDQLTAMLFFHDA
jgi:hypothetical protein